MNLEPETPEMEKNSQIVIRNLEKIAKEIQLQTKILVKLEKHFRLEEQKEEDLKNYEDEEYKVTSKQEKIIYSSVIPGLKLEKRITLQLRKRDNYPIDPLE